MKYILYVKYYPGNNHFLSQLDSHKTEKYNSIFTMKENFSPQFKPIMHVILFLLCKIIYETANKWP